MSTLLLAGVWRGPNVSAFAGRSEGALGWGDIGRVGGIGMLLVRTGYSLNKREGGILVATFVGLAVAICVLSAGAA